MLIYNVFESGLKIRKKNSFSQFFSTSDAPLGLDRQKIVSGSQRQQYPEHFIILSPVSCVLHKSVSKPAVLPVMQDTWTCWSSVVI